MFKRKEIVRTICFVIGLGLVAMTSFSVAQEEDVLYEKKTVYNWYFRNKRRKSKFKSTTKLFQSFTRIIKKGLLLRPFLF